MGRLTALVLGSAAGETFLNRFSLPDMPLGMGEQRTLKWLAIGLCHVEIFGGVKPDCLNEREKSVLLSMSGGNRFSCDFRLQERRLSQGGYRCAISCSRLAWAP
jgi:hypothetical protein